jgi:DNA-binding SARP family transcriptional activator
MRFWRDGTEVPLGPPKQRAVLGLLASRLGEVVSMHQIVDGVWGADVPQSAASGVHTYVAGLRRVVDPSRGRRKSGRVLVSASGGYCLNLPPHSVDSHRFGRHCATAGSLLTDGRSEEAITELERGLALWHGAALADVPGPHAEMERVRLTESRLMAVEEWADLLLEAGRHRQVVPVLVGHVSGEPLRERLRWQLMLALYRCGRRGQALGVYRETRQVLMAELGVGPGPELTALHQRILDGDPDLMPRNVLGSVQLLRSMAATDAGDARDAMEGAAGRRRRTGGQRHPESGLPVPARAVRRPGR